MNLGPTRCVLIALAVAAAACNSTRTDGLSPHPPDTTPVASFGVAPLPLNSEFDGLVPGRSAPLLSESADGAPAPEPPVDAVRSAAPSGYVRIDTGSFTMGSPTSEAGRAADEIEHEVRITRGYFLKATEVTQAEWRSVMGTNPPGRASCERCPVDTVSWEDAVAYVNKLSEREGLPRCYGSDGNFVGLACSGYRLPTEAEWEYAARAGSREARYGALDAVAWHGGNSGAAPHEVGGKQANAWGLHDMLGNAWEWVHDWKGDYPASATDPTGASTTGGGRVVRGGSWSHNAGDVRAAYRIGVLPADRGRSFGFRPARSIP